MAGEELFNKVGGLLPKAEKSKMFGMPCYKVNGKAFCGYFEGDMVFKLGGPAHQEALSLDGSKLFDPSEMNRPMKEWVQVSPAHSKQWEKFARAALTYVESAAKKSK